MKSRISRRIISLILLVVTLPLMVINLSLYFHGKKIIREQISTILNITSGSIKSQIEFLIFSKKSRTRDFSSDGFITSALEKLNQAPQHAYTAEALKNHLVKNKSPLDRDILDIIIFNKNGMAILSTSDSAAGKIHVEPEYFSEGRKGTSVGTIEGKSGERHYTISTPLYSKKGNGFLGVISVRYKASGVDKILSGEIERLRRGKTLQEYSGIYSRVYLIDRDKTIISHSMPEFIGKKTDTEIVRNALSSGSIISQEYEGMTGEHRVGTAMYLNEPGWLVLVSFSRDEAYASLYRQTYGFIFLALAGILIAALLTIIITRRITKPIIKIAEATRRVSAGIFDAEVEAGDNKDEISELAAAFNSMTTKLREAFQSIQANEKALSTINRFYSVLTKINEAIIRADSPEELFSHACRIPVDDGLFRLVWVGKTVHEPHLLEPVVYYGADEGYFELVSNSIYKISGSPVFPGKVIMEGEHYVCNKIKSDRCEHAWCEEITDYGLYSVAAFPLRIKDTTTGIIFFYSDQPAYFNDEIIKLLERMTGDMSYALDFFEQERQYKLSEEEKAKLESQLLHIQKMDAIGQLTGGIAHDFNNLLTAIIGNCSILQMKMDKESNLASYINQTLAASEKAANLTKKLLAFSRKQIIEIRPASLKDVILGIEKLLRRVIGEDVELRVNLPDDDIIIMADSGQIEQVLMNMAANARDAMPNGGSLSISADIMYMDRSFIKSHGYGRHGEYAMITFTDTGTGMDSATQQKIFEPFFTTKEVGKGTGLGLSIVYGIIKQHSGYVNVCSEPGKGTTFKIYLPVIESKIDASQLHEVSIPKRGKETILVIEDQDEVRNLTRGLLEDFGYTILDATDGEDALTKFNKNMEKIDLILVDVVMPRKNGKEVYEEIIKIRPDIRTIFTSGYNDEIIHKNNLIEAGFNFISKPYIPSELLRKIREVLDSPLTPRTC